MVVVIWIDWYSYHLARFRALARHPAFAGAVTGIELVGKGGVHRGLAFRDASRDNLPIETLMPGSSWQEVPQWRLASKLWRKLDELAPEVVLVPGYYTLPGIAAALWAKWNGAHSVLMTESGERDHARIGWKESAKGMLIRYLFDSASVGGQDHLRYLLRFRFRSDRIGGFYDTVDNEFFAREAANYRRSSSAQSQGLPTRYFLYVGRLAEEKNLARLVEAFALYRGRGGDWSLVLAGEGPQRQQLEATAQRLGVADSVLFPGLLRTADLPRFYAFASCFVLASSREPWGLVVNEAMASSLPVLVSSHCGCAADLVEPGVNGSVFNPLDTAGLSHSLTSVSDLPEAERALMGQRSRDRIARFSPDHWAGDVAALVSPAKKLEAAA